MHYFVSYSNKLQFVWIVGYLELREKGFYSTLKTAQISFLTAVRARSCVMDVAIRAIIGLV